MGYEQISYKETYNLFKNELMPFYPLHEINSFFKILIDHFLNITPAEFHLSYQKNLNPAFYHQILTVIDQLKKYKPIQYILRETVFYDLIFKVNNNVLIPRPETEELVYWILQDLPDLNYSVLDIGTGSGCIGIAIKKNRPSFKVTATDYTDTVLKVTKENAKLNCVNINIKKFDLFHEKKFHKLGKYDIIVSNPPYIPQSQKKYLHKNVLEYEPERALFVDDNNPLIFYEFLAKLAKTNLKAKGKLYVEMNEFLGTETMNKIWSGEFREIIIKKDINGKERMIRASK